MTDAVLNEERLEVKEMIPYRQMTKEEMENVDKYFSTKYPELYEKLKGNFVTNNLGGEAWPTVLVAARSVVWQDYQNASGTPSCEGYAERTNPETQGVERRYGAFASGNLSEEERTAVADVASQNPIPDYRGAA